MKLDVKTLTLRYSNRYLYLSDYLLLLYIASVIIVSMIPIGNIVSQIIGAVLFVYFLFYLVITDKKKILISSEFQFIIGFLLFIFISGYFAKDFTLVTSKIKTVIQLIILFTIGYSLIVQNRINIKHFYYTIIFSVFAIVIFGMFSHITDPILTRNRLTSTAGDPNFLAVLSAFAALFAYGMFTVEKSKSLKFILLSIIIIMVYGIIQTQSRQGILLVFFNLFGLAVVNYYKRFWNIIKKFQLYKLFGTIIVLSIITSIFVYLFLKTNYFLRIQLLISYIKLSLTSSNANNIILTADTSVFERKQLIMNGIRMWLDHPFFGVGIDNYRLTIREYWPISRKLYAHNNYIELASTIGAFGTIAYYLVYYSLYKKIRQYKLKVKSSELLLKYHNILLITFLGILFIEIFTVTYYVKFIWIFLFIMIGTLDKQKLTDYIHS